MLLCYGWFLYTHQWKKHDNRFMCVLSKSWKSENFSITSTGREKVIDLSNELQDELLKGIIERELEKRKRKENRTENNEAESSVLVELDRLSKQQKSNDNRSNECIICGNKTLKDTKLSRLSKTERAELFLRATKFNMDAVFTKVSIFDKPDDLFGADIMSRKQCMNR